METTKPQTPVTETKNSPSQQLSPSSMIPETVPESYSKANQEPLNNPMGFLIMGCLSSAENI